MAVAMAGQFHAAILIDRLGLRQGHAIIGTAVVIIDPLFYRRQIFGAVETAVHIEGTFQAVLLHDSNQPGILKHAIIIAQCQCPRPGAGETQINTVHYDTPF